MELQTNTWSKNRSYFNCFRRVTTPQSVSTGWLAQLVCLYVNFSLDIWGQSVWHNEVSKIFRNENCPLTRHTVNLNFFPLYFTYLCVRPWIRVICHHKLPIKSLPWSVVLTLLRGSAWINCREAKRRKSWEFWFRLKHLFCFLSLSQYLRLINGYQNYKT